MKKSIKIIAQLITVSLILVKCTEPYAPPNVKTDQNLLVVDALLDGSLGEVSVRLSRTIPLSQTSEQRPELEANVSIETSQGNAFNLFDNSSNGQYSLAGIPIIPEDSYRLVIITKDGRRYQSEYLELMQTSPIDSISWKPNDTGTDIFVNTHDYENKTGFYRWEFSETWAYNSAFQSIYDFSGDYVIDRNDNIYNCYQSFNSSNILIKSTANLSQALVSEFPLTFIPKRSERLFIRYSILVKQFALTKEAYEFWDLLRKNTESLGGLFDPLPSQLVGNIVSLDDPNETVLGYFSASTVSESRIFISLTDLPDGYKFTDIYPTCVKDTVLLDKLPTFNKSNSILISGYYAPGLVGYFYSSNVCADCRLKSGTNQKPSFW